MSTSSLLASTDSIDDEHNTVKAATDNIVYTVIIYQVHLAWIC